MVNVVWYMLHDIYMEVSSSFEDSAISAVGSSLMSHLQAFTNIEGIIAKSQALMVARGDLGVELGLNRVPFAQKLLIQRAKQVGRC